MITRKKFILLSSLGFLSAITPNYLFANDSFKIVADEISELLKLAKNYRINKRYELANSTYLKVIKINPAEIRAYDGMRKSYLAQKNREMDVVRLFLQASLVRPNDLLLRERLFKEYLNLSLGKKKLLPQLNIGGRILLVVRDKLTEIAGKSPEKKSLSNQLAKINRYIDFNIDQIHPHKNKKLKEYRKNQRNNYKDRFNTISSEKATSLLSKLEKKIVSKDREGHIRELYKVNIRTLRKEKKYSDALKITQKYLTSKKFNDPYFVKEFRNLSKYQKDYENLIAFEIKNHDLKKSFWSAISLYDAHFKNISHKKLPPNSTMDSLLNFIASKVNDPNQSFEYITRKIKIEILKNNIAEARSLLLTQLEKMVGSSCTHLIDRLNIIASEYYNKINDSDGKLEILNISTSPKLFIENSDELKKAIALMNLHRSYAKPIHILNLQKKINSI